MYKSDDVLTVSFAIEFGNNEFQTHCTDSTHCLFFISRTEMYTLENQAFVAICDGLFFSIICPSPLFVQLICIYNQIRQQTAGLKHWSDGFQSCRKI